MSIVCSDRRVVFAIDGFEEIAFEVEENPSDEEIIECLRRFVRSASRMELGENPEQFVRNWLNLRGEDPELWEVVVLLPGWIDVEHSWRERSRRLKRSKRSAGSTKRK